MLDRKRRKVGIADEITGGSGLGEKAGQQVQVPRRWFDRDGGRLDEPRTQNGRRLIGRQWPFEDPRCVDSRRNASKTSQAKPIVSGPASAASSQARARAWCTDDELTA